MNTLVGIGWVRVLQNILWSWEGDMGYSGDAAMAESPVSMRPLWKPSEDVSLPEICTSKKSLSKDMFIDFFREGRTEGGRETLI